jgi:hypothetical protein
MKKIIAYRIVHALNSGATLQLELEDGKTAVDLNTSAAVAAAASVLLNPAVYYDPHYQTLIADNNQIA